MRTMREGFTFVELLLVLVLGTMLLGAVYETLSRQEQAYGLFNAVAGTQQDTRMGMDLLAAEFRELSTGGGDLLMATEDSVRIRALRKFGIVCLDDKSAKKFSLASFGPTQFAAGDSFFVYVDQDSLKASDDIWQRDLISSVGTLSNCGTSLLSQALGALMPDATLQIVTVAGAGLRFDSIFPGAPIRSFETLSYRTGTMNGERWVQRVRGDTLSPLFGPVAPTNGFKISYYDTLGVALTTYPLSPAQRRSVNRIRIDLRAQRRAGGPGSSYTDSLVTDIYLRGG